MASVHPATFSYPEAALDWVPLTLSSDADLTDSGGQTGGVLPRRIMIGGTGGNIKVDTVLGTGRVIAVSPYQIIPIVVTKVYSSGNGTTATPVYAGI